MNRRLQNEAAISSSFNSSSLVFSLSASVFRNFQRPVIPAESRSVNSLMCL